MTDDVSSTRRVKDDRVMAMNAVPNSNSGYASHSVDADPTETREWVESLESVLRAAGPERAQFLLNELEDQLRQKGLRASVQPYSAYRNTIPA
jgi:pyruvate dehydrogenase E1 component